ncbi:MAG: hypothetical protein ACI3Y8_00795 [Candidatus Cryptobacteroides sp.]
MKTYLALIISLVVISSCSSYRKLNNIKTGATPAAQLALSEKETYVPQLKNSVAAARDTLKITDDDGTEMLIMKAVKDDQTGEMVATDVIDAAKVTARFRNVAERHGKVDLAFQVIVPKTMMDSKWQLRFYPDLFVLGDSTRLETVVVTGAGYRKAQLRGYQQYGRFLSRIVEDTTKFINIKQLEFFLKRNIPEIYQFKTDTAFVSDEKFASCFGVTQQQAIEHYTNKAAVARNKSRINRKSQMFSKYVKAPIVSEGIRLDTVIVNAEGDFIYNYVQTINVRPKLRKADIVLSGDIFEQDKKIYTVPASEPLTFYISSVSAFVDNTERYMTTVIERRATANAAARIEFAEGQSDIDPELSDNEKEIRLVKKTLSSLLSDDVYDLDSVIVSATASPEGSLSYNRNLAQRRSEAVSEYFNAFMRHYSDSLSKEAGIVLNMDDTYKAASKAPSIIRFSPRCIPENWSDLADLVAADKGLADMDKKSFAELVFEPDLDEREAKLKRMPYYQHLRNDIYPKLRLVKFNFFLHRKGMVKDTVHTTVLDTTYMNGVQALRDMDYQGAVLRLRNYNDFNAAVAFVGMDMNESALAILEKLEKTDKVNYLLALVYSRKGMPEKAVECYVKACRQNRAYVYRGNLDPEISVLIKAYGLNQEDEDEL